MNKRTIRHYVLVTITAMFCWLNTSVSGGSGNTASGDRSSVSGGYQREASGLYDWAAGSLSQDQ
jgi:hypothetical protein